MRTDSDRDQVGVGLTELRGGAGDLVYIIGFNAGRLHDDRQRLRGSLGVCSGDCCNFGASQYWILRMKTARSSVPATVSPLFDEDVFAYDEPGYASPWEGKATLAMTQEL